jgi:hypothetical protein
MSGIFNIKTSLTEGCQTFKNYQLESLLIRVDKESNCHQLVREMRNNDLPSFLEVTDSVLNVISCAISLKIGWE